MRRVNEKIQDKLYSMSSILLGNVIIPRKIEQEGSDSIVASYYDDNENKYTFTLSLNVTPKEKTEEDSEEPVTMAEQISMILSKLTSLEEDVEILKGYHASSNTPSSDDLSVPNTTTDNTNNQEGNNSEQGGDKD